MFIESATKYYVFIEKTYEYWKLKWKKWSHDSANH